MIRWRSADCANVASPSAAASLLERAIAERPANALLRLKLADLHLDRYDFAAAADALEKALDIDAGLAGVRPRLGRCYNYLGRHERALAVLAPVDSPDFQRASAYAGLGLEAEAEREYRSLLAAEPGHRHALRHLGKTLRRQGRIDELLDLCEALDAGGVGHSQLLYTWGTALALAGRDAAARAILFDRGRVAELALPVPEGFADIAEFNEALADEILSNPYRLSDFPVEDEANRGSSRVHALFAGRRPELVRALLASFQALVDAHAPPRYDGFDPWIDARPATAHIKAWGLIQRGDDYEEWHSHPGGWLSGVYYVRVPASVSSEGPGCIEFGPPTALARARAGYVEPWRHVPRPGFLLLAPSHYAHRTIPTGADEHRISFAFDVVPERRSVADTRS
ncbi:MAG TPA: putative 2OG-Fe(II) oxygenase [Allosphingosinicella sp.]|nr:putative 2OG-Fe(II) oxygenase [Allosphingosinicella sp.]